jgi:glycosyltransferase involved in cell wall biosynthesis
LEKILLLTPLVLGDDYLKPDSPSPNIPTIWLSVNFDFLIAHLQRYGSLYFQPVHRLGELTTASNYLRKYSIMVKNIKISIVTATWNCANTLPDCLASVARQSYANREHVIIDGSSIDGTIDVINQHIDQIYKFKSERDKGIYDALNKGIQISTGDVVGFLHADDLYASDDALFKIAQAFEDPRVSAVYGNLEYVSQQDASKVIRRWQCKPFDRRSLGWGWMPAHPTLYVRRNWYSKIGGFDISYRIAADYLSILKLFTQPGFKAEYIPEVLVNMRLGGASNKSVKAIINKSKEDWRALRSCNFSVLSALRAIVWKNLSKLSQFA